METVGDLNRSIKGAPAGADFAKYCWARMKARNDPAAFGEIMDRFKHLPRLAKFSKAAVAAGSTAAAAWGSDLSGYDGVASEFVELTNAQSVFGRIGARRINFNTRTIFGASPTSAEFVKPGGAIAVTAMSLDDAAALKPYKVATISLFTNESLAIFNRATQQNILDRLGVSVVRGLDSALLDPDSAGTAEETPASLTNGISPSGLFGSTAATALSSIETLLQAHVTAGSDLSRVSLVMSPSTCLTLSLMQVSNGNSAFPQLGATGGSIVGIPVYTTASAVRSGSPPERLVVAVDGSKVVYADDGGTEISLGRNATLQMDDSPTGDASNGTATSVVSMFQVESTAIKVVRILNFARAHSSAISWMTANY